MAARALLRHRAVVPLTALALGGYVMTPGIVYAESPDGIQSKKPIYDDLELPPTKDVIGVPSRPEPPAEPRRRRPTPTDRLAVQIGRARHFLYSYAVSAEDAVNRTMDSAFHLEQSFTSTIASLAPPPESGEKLMPGVIYVLVAAMAGNIFTRNRNILLRATAPIVLGIGAGSVVLPITMGNVANLAWRYEQRFPAVAQAHQSVQGGIEKGWSFTKAHTRAGVQYVDGAVTDTREKIEGWVRKGK